jgi:hypothetical protein
VVRAGQWSARHGASGISSQQYLAALVFTRARLVFTRARPTDGESDHDYRYPGPAYPVLGGVSRPGQDIAALPEHQRGLRRQRSQQHVEGEDVHRERLWP